MTRLYTAVAIVMIIILAIGGTVAEGQEEKPLPWMLVEQTKYHGIGHLGLPEYSIKGRIVKTGQRWSIFTNSTLDFENIAVGLVYRCLGGGREQWCPEGRIERMSVLYLPITRK